MLTTLLTSCANDDGTTSGKPTLTASSGTTITATYDITKSVAFTFTASDDWTIDYDSDEMTLSDTEGTAGTKVVTITLKQYNCQNENIAYSFTVKSSNSHGSASMKVTVQQQPVFEVEKLVQEADAEGDTIDFVFKANCSLNNGIYVMTRNAEDYKAMVLSVDFTTKSAKTFTMRTVISKNEGNAARSLEFYLAIDTESKQHSAICEITQTPTTLEHSTDTITNDGVVEQLWRHTIGQGVPIVIMGDGFLDRDISDGTYRNTMEKACNEYFNIEPMASLKEYFDVFIVNAISYNNVFSSSTRTAFSCQYAGGQSTRIDGNTDKVEEYATKALTGYDKRNATALVILNDDRYAGTCVMFYPTAKATIARGFSIAFIPMIADSGNETTSFATILHHEAVGHAFGKLADEYGNTENGSLTDDAKATLAQQQGYGYMMNITTEADVTASPWAQFAADSRYSSEKLSCYEGGYTYVNGIYRATEESIMRNNTGGFNVQQRKLIYCRCMAIANNYLWSFDYDEFVAFDRKAQSSSTAKATRAKAAAVAQAKAAAARTKAATTRAKTATATGSTSAGTPSAVDAIFGSQRSITRLPAPILIKE